MELKKKRKKAKTDIEQIEESSNNSLQSAFLFEPNKGNFDRIISTNSTLIDCAISGTVQHGGGVPGGILIEISGPSGKGKCITGDSFIIGNNKLSPIASFSKNRKGFTPEKIPIITKEGKSFSSHFYEEEVFETYQIKNNLAIELQGTPEHSIYVLNPDCSFSFKKLEDIKKGDVCCILRTLNIFPEKEVKIKLNYEQIKKTNALLLKVPQTLNLNIARLLGYIIANGSNKNKGAGAICFSSKNKKIVADFFTIIKELGFEKLPFSYNEKDYSFGGIWLKKFVCMLLNEKTIPTARFKKVPDYILNSPKEHQIQFLQSLFDCDSSLYKNHLEYSTASKILASQIQMMLLNLGIISSKRAKFLKKQDHTYWTIDIYGNEVNSFLNIIKSIKYNNFELKNHSTIKDKIPYLKENILNKIERIKQKYDWKKNGTFYYKEKRYRFPLGDIIHSHKNKEITYSYLYSLIEKIKPFSFIPEFEEILNICMNFKKSNYFFSKILNTEKITNPVTVYDFVIPKNHNFFSNGYISHNTALLASLCASCQSKGGEARFSDTEARLDQLYSQIYNMKMDEQFFDYHRPDTVDEMFDLIWGWKPKNPEAINIFGGDSIAALSTDLELDKGDKMGMKRAKDISAGLRKTCRMIANNNWIVALTNQIRQKQGGGTTTPGGEGVGFHASLRLKIKAAFPNEFIKEKVKFVTDKETGKLRKAIGKEDGKEEEVIIGIHSVCQIVKSSVDVPYRSAPFDIIFGYGIDDIRANLQYIKDIKKDTVYMAVNKSFPSIKKAIQHIETENLEQELREKTITLWEEVQILFKQNRKRREIY